MSSPLEQRLLKVRGTADVVMLRQAVRAAAREARLGLAAQARITAAISEVARALVVDGINGDFLIQFSLESAFGLEILCSAGGSASTQRKSTMRAFSEASSLVDEAALTEDEHGAQLTLKMRSEREQ